MVQSANMTSEPESILAGAFHTRDFVQIPPTCSFTTMSNELDDLLADLSADTENEQIAAEIGGAR